MSWFLGGSSQGSNRNAANPQQEAIDKLVDRAGTSTRLSDRRSAIFGLKDLAEENKLDVGSKGLEVIAKSLKDDREDPEIVKACLEVLLILCSEDDDQIGAMLAEIYTKNPENVTLLVELLKDSDFQIRFPAVQLLSLLHNGSPAKVQECILTDSMGLSHLIDLLDDRREVIRNEGLLLLVSITETNTDIQKIVAFQNVFEKILTIVKEEDVITGGIIVQDCLQLIHNLIKHNTSNQNLFRETSCVNQVSKLLLSDSLVRCFQGNIDSNFWNSQSITNILLLMEVFRILCGPKNPSSAANQHVISQINIIPVLLKFSFSNMIPGLVKTQSLLALGDCIRGFSKSQDILLGDDLEDIPLVNGTDDRNSEGLTRSQSVLTNLDISIRKRITPSGIISELIRIMLTASQMNERSSACWVLESFFYKNVTGKIVFLNTLFDESEEVESINNAPPAILIRDTMLDWDRKDPFKCWFASVVFAHAIMDCSEAKELAMKATVDDIPLLSRIMHGIIMSTRETLDARISLGLLCLICTWCYDFKSGVQEVLLEGANIRFFVLQINQPAHNNTLLQGISAYLLGILYSFYSGVEGSLSKDDIGNLLKSRVGIETFISRLETLRESKEITSASPHFFTSTTIYDEKGFPDIYFDYAFVTMFRSSVDQIMSNISLKEEDENDIIEKNVLIHTLEEQVKELEECLAVSEIVDEDKIIVAKSEYGHLINKVKELETYIYNFTQEKNNHIDYLTKENQRFQEDINNSISLQNQLNQLQNSYNLSLQQNNSLQYEISNLKQQLDNNLRSSESQEFNLKQELDRVNQENSYLKNIQQQNQQQQQQNGLGSQALKKELDELKAKYQELQAEEEDLLLLMAEQDTELEQLRSTVQF